MDNQFELTWEQYVSSWKAQSKQEKLSLFEGCLASTCVYSDPTVTTRGWEELAVNMLNFEKQIPGGHFVTTYFLAHSDKSIAKWEMRNGENQVIGDGISYGEYDASGKIIAMTGFFEA